MSSFNIGKSIVSYSVQQSTTDGCACSYNGSNMCHLMNEFMQTSQEHILQEQTPQEEILQKQSYQKPMLQEQSSQEQMFQEKFSQEQMLLEQFSQEEMFQEKFSQEQMLREQFSQEQMLQEQFSQEQMLQEQFSQEQMLKADIKQEHMLSKLPTDINGVQILQRNYTLPDNIQQSDMNKLIVNVESDAAKANGSSSTHSDNCSDFSDIPSSILSASSGSSYVLPVVEGISEQDINQVDLFYRSHKTDVKVCRSLTNLYVSAKKVKTETQNSRSKKKSIRDKKSKPGQSLPPVHLGPSDISKEEWVFAKTGIPVLVLDMGVHVREKRLKIVLAEKGTGFTLWQDELNNLTVYSTPHTNFHTVTTSTDTTCLVGLSFDESNAAAEFAEAVKKMSASAFDDLINNRSMKKKKPRQKYKPLKKADISQPVCFVHVTKLQPPDLVSGMFPPPPSGVKLSHSVISRAISDSSGISECSTTLTEH